MGTMALTRAAFLPWYTSASIRSVGRRCAALLLPVVLSACATGVGDAEFGPDDFSEFDSAAMVPPTMVPPIEEGGVILPPYDAGVPVVPVIPPRDSGTRDSGSSGPRDSGTPPTPVDSGSLDSGSQPPLDSGSQPPLDSGSEPPPDAGGGSSGQMCAAAPNYPTTSECGKCTCMRCATQITSCAASTDSAKNTQCLAVRSCAEKNSCSGQGCYCGSSPLCFNPDGPCRQEIETAAGGSDLSTIQEASMNADSPVGRSVAVGECQLQNCRRECGL